MYTAEENDEAAIIAEVQRYNAAVRQVRTPADVARIASALGLDEGELRITAALADAIGLGGHHYALAAETYGLDADATDDLVGRLLTCGCEVEEEAA